MQIDRTLRFSNREEVEAALARARRIAANLSGDDDRRTVERYIVELEDELRKVE